MESDEKFCRVLDNLTEIGKKLRPDCYGYIFVPLPQTVKYFSAQIEYTVRIYPIIDLDKFQELVTELGGIPIEEKL